MQNARASLWDSILLGFILVEYTAYSVLRVLAVIRCCVTSVAQTMQVKRCIWGLDVEVMPPVGASKVWARLFVFGEQSG